MFGRKGVVVSALGRRTRLWAPITRGSWCFVASDHSRNLGVTSSGHSKSTDRCGARPHTAWCLGKMTDAVVATMTTTTTGRRGVTCIASRRFSISSSKVSKFDGYWGRGERWGRCEQRVPHMKRRLGNRGTHVCACDSNCVFEFV